jgi:transposase-like protein
MMRVGSGAKWRAQKSARSSSRHLMLISLLLAAHAAQRSRGMVLFCPTCANILLVEAGPVGHRFYCQTCPYIFNVTDTVTNRQDRARKKVDDVYGDEKLWENAAREAGMAVASWIRLTNSSYVSDVSKVRAQGGVLYAAADSLCR